jgi:hypothetical protein
MIWVLLLLTAGLLVWFLLQPRRLQTLENIPAVVDEKFKAHGVIETTEDPREVEPIARAAADAAGDRPVPGHGDSLTGDWPSDPQEPHAQGQRPDEGPLNNRGETT